MICVRTESAEQVFLLTFLNMGLFRVEDERAQCEGRTICVDWVGVEEQGGDGEPLTQMSQAGRRKELHALFSSDECSGLSSCAPLDYYIWRSIK